MATAAVIVLALSLPRSVEQPQPSTPVAASRPLPEAAAPPRIATAQPRVDGQPLTRRPRIARGVARRVTAEPDRSITAAAFAPADITAEIEPLKSITPIQMTPIADHRIAPAEISVRPLSPVVELQIAPLSPSERRN